MFSLLAVDVSPFKRTSPTLLDRGTSRQQGFAIASDVKFTEGTSPLIADQTIKGSVTVVEKGEGSVYMGIMKYPGTAESGLTHVGRGRRRHAFNEIIPGAIPSIDTTLYNGRPGNGSLLQGHADILTLPHPCGSPNSGGARRNSSNCVPHCNFRLHTRYFIY